MRHKHPFYYKLPLPLFRIINWYVTNKNIETIQVAFSSCRFLSHKIELLLWGLFNVSDYSEKRVAMQRNLFCASRKLCGLGWPEEYNEIAEKNETFINKACEEALKNEEIMKHLVLCCQIRSFLCSYYHEEESKRYLAKARELDPGAKSLDLKEFRKIHKKLSKESLILKRQDPRASEDIFKIDLSLESLKGAFYLLSLAFLVTGYLINKYYLGYFGIDVSRYFTLTDYLASSIDRIHLAAFSGFFALAGIFLFLHRESEMNYVDSPRTLLLNDIQFGFVLFPCTVYAIYSFLNDDIRKYSSLIPFLALIGGYLSGRLASIYFSNPRQAVFVLLFVYIFSWSIAISILEDINKVNKMGINELKKVRLEPKRPQLFDQSKFIILASNSNYYFLYSKYNGNTLIIPKSSIAYEKPLKRGKI